MKKLFLVCISLALFAGKGTAQSVSYYKMSKAEMVQNMAYDAPHLYKKYQSGSTLSGFGMGLTLGGLAAAIIGVATADKETVSNGASTQVNLSGSGAGIFAAGLVCAVAGTPLWIIGSTKKKNARNTYLREYDYGYIAPSRSTPYFQINAASKGLGLAFVF